MLLFRAIGLGRACGTLAVANTFLPEKNTV